jgi:hypothetical protein
MPKMRLLASAVNSCMPTEGRFSNGLGEVYDSETYAGRTILVRYVFDDITARSCRFVQSFPADSGKTWEPNMVALFLAFIAPPVAALR